MELVKKGLYVGYKFVCGLQTFCMWVTNVLYAGHKHFVCGSQTFCMRVTNILYAGHKRFVCGLQTFVLWLQFLVMTLIDLCMTVKRFKTM